jgi:hypothetical protein
MLEKRFYLIFKFLMLGVVVVVVVVVIIVVFRFILKQLIAKL